MAGRVAFGLGGGLSALGGALIDDSNKQEKLSDQRQTAQLAFDRAQAAAMFDKVASGSVEPEQGQAMLAALGVKTPLEALKSFRPSIDTVTRAIDEKTRAASTPDAVPSTQQISDLYKPYRVPYQDPKPGPMGNAVLWPDQMVSPQDRQVADRIDQAVKGQQDKYHAFAPVKIGEHMTNEGTPQAQMVDDYAHFNPTTQTFEPFASVPKGATAGGQADVDRLKAQGTALGTHSPEVAKAEAAEFDIQTPGVVKRTGMNAEATKRGTNRGELADQVAMRAKLAADAEAEDAAHLKGIDPKVQQEAWSKKAPEIAQASSSGLLLASELKKLMPQVKDDMAKWGTSLNPAMKGAIIQSLADHGEVTEKAPGIVGTALRNAQTYAMPQGVRLYMQKINPRLGELARLGGQVNRLNESEQARAKEYAPTIQDFIEGTADAKMQQFRAYLSILPEIHQLDDPRLIPQRPPDFNKENVIADRLQKRMAIIAQQDAAEAAAGQK